MSLNDNFTLKTLKDKVNTYLKTKINNFRKTTIDNLRYDVDTDLMKAILNYAAERKGLDTIYDHGKYIEHEHDLFEMTGLGMIADNGRLLGTGAYILKGSYVVFLDSKSNYREFITRRYGIKRK